jgi:hypothetical protein
MGSMFANAPVVPTTVAIQVARIYFDAPCRFCRDGRRATTNLRPIDTIGRPMGNMDVCEAHAEQLVARARAKNLEVSIWPPVD